MKLEVFSHILSIDDETSMLTTSQISQISFWGFRKVSNNRYELSKGNIDEILPKVCGYLNEQNLFYSLSQSCAEMMRVITNKFEASDQFRRIGKDFKEGKFDKSRFIQFVEFTHSLARPLKDHQLKAAFHLYLVENGANFSVPGSGKTSVALAVYEKLRLEGKVKLLYVVGPPACFRPWRDEFKLTLGREPSWRILAGGESSQRKSEYYVTESNRVELYLTTFQTLLNDQDDVGFFLNHSGNSAFLVVDEAHYIKQSGGTWADAVLRISNYSKYRYALTGTPMPKSYADLFNIFDFLSPNRSLLDADEKIKITICESKKDLKSARETVEKTIAPFFYRVRKSELGLTPQRFHEPIVIKMNKFEKIIYDAIENKIRNYTEQDYINNIDIVQRLWRGRIIRLRQSVSYVKLLSSAIEGYNESLIDDKSELAKIIIGYDRIEIPAKLEYLTKLVQKLRNENRKIVVWANFVGVLHLITKHLNENYLKCKLIYGGTPTENTTLEEEETRESIREEFVDINSGLDILVANPAACGESISLHKTCFDAIYYDLSYNCAQYLQSLDRIHRVGGSEINYANYHFLQYQDTIDQDIKHNLEEKTKKMQEIIDQEYGVYSLDMFQDEDDIEAYKRLFVKDDISI